MGRALCTLTLCGILLASSDGLAQRQDLSGTWTLASEKKQGDPSDRAPGVGGFHCATECTISQTDQQLTVTRKQGNGSASLVFKLDGSDSKNAVVGRTGVTEIVSKAKSEGSHLVVSTTVKYPSVPPLTSTQRVSVSGGEMTVEVVTEPGRPSIILTYKRTQK